MAAAQGSRAAMLIVLSALLVSRINGEHPSTTTTAQRNDELDVAQKERNNFLHEPPDLDQELELGEQRRYFREPEFGAAGYNHRLMSEELEKRAPMGFQGMRGKKANEYYLQGANSYDEPVDYYYGDYKRAPMGFQGMRGKKGGDDYYLYDELDKRAPMGFQGMRGKKSLEQVLNELEKRRMIQGFQGMRGKKDELQGAVDEVADWQKRVPTGFMGMRGRKSAGLADLEEYDKRALYGFHGMRGKKSATYDHPELDNGYLAKRPMMMGFHGMRGKRSTNYYDDGRGYVKRASSYRFYGSRGKKNPRWELRGKFVGVRGKKWTAAPHFVQTHPRYIDDRTFFSLNPDARH